MAEREVILLIESDPTEAVLATAAVALRSDATVMRVADLGAAPGVLARARVGLAILGRRAIGAAEPELLQAFVKDGVPVIGVAPGLGEAERARALAAGVSQVHERPRQWPAYRVLIAGLLAEWLPTRTG
jgi:hypothetical protein